MNSWVRSALSLGSMLGAERALSTIRGLELNDALQVIGLSRKPTTLDQTLPALGYLVVGAVVGAGTALLFAPCSGAEMRQRFADRLSVAKSRVEEAMHSEERGSRVPQDSSLPTGNYSMQS